MMLKLLAIAGIVTVYVITLALCRAAGEADRQEERRQARRLKEEIANERARDAGSAVCKE